jgi:hypothetical protein
LTKKCVPGPLAVFPDERNLPLRIGCGSLKDRSDRRVIGRLDFLRPGQSYDSK